MHPNLHGMHEEFVFVWRRERVKNVDDVPFMPYRPVQMMTNTAWQNARKKAGLGDLHVHDLRHTSGMRLREAGVAATRSRRLLYLTYPVTRVMPWGDVRRQRPSPFLAGALP